MKLTELLSPILNEVLQKDVEGFAHRLQRDIQHSLQISKYEIAINRFIHGSREDPSVRIVVNVYTPMDMDVRLAKRVVGKLVKKHLNDTFKNIKVDDMGSEVRIISDKQHFIQHVIQILEGLQRK